MAAKTAPKAVTIGGVTLLATSAIVSRIDAIKGKRESYQQEVHDVALQALATYANSGDNTLILRLLGGFSRKRVPGTANQYAKTAEHPGVLGVDRGWLLDWFARFSDIRFNGSMSEAKSGVAKGVPSSYIYIMDPVAKSTVELTKAIGTTEGADGKARTVNLLQAAKNPWWTLEKAAANGTRNAIDLLNMFAITASLAKRLETAKQREEEGEAGSIIKAQEDRMESYVKAMQAADAKWQADNKVDVVELEAERVKRKALAGQAEADVQRPVTTGANVANDSTAALTGPGTKVA